SFFGWPLAGTIIGVVAIGVGGDIASKAIQSGQHRPEVVPDPALLEPKPVVGAEAAAERGRLVVKSSPAATLVINDRPERCVTPCNLELPPGRYVAKLINTDMESSVHDVEIRSGRSTKLSAVLEPREDQGEIARFEALYRRVGKQLELAHLPPRHRDVRRYLDINYARALRNTSIRERNIKTLESIARQVERLTGVAAEQSVGIFRAKGGYQIRLGSSGPFVNEVTIPLGDKAELQYRKVGSEQVRVLAVFAKSERPVTIP
ncbi:MAG: PEGA domain-containing protein, partial [Deltaproteobacteria bacterium]|nr:PEGA domain-containing protein [Deltaproteobacteria bacterium]